MEALIPINHSEGGPVVSARTLHSFLESRQAFTDWIKARITKYDFTEGVDFIITFGESTGGRPSTDYALTLDTAKELAMVEGNAKGKQARRYFIDCERQANQTAVLPQSQGELILMLAQQNVENEKRLTQLENRIEQVAASALTSDADYYTIAGYASFLHIPMPPMVASVYGRRAAELSRQQGIAVGSVHDARYGKVGTYHRGILEEVFSARRL